MSNGDNAARKIVEIPKPRVLQTKMVQACEIARNKKQPRKRFREIEALRASRLKAGQKKRIEIFAFTDESNPTIKYKIFDGERRWRSCDPHEWLECDIIEEPENEFALFWGSFVANNSGDEHTHKEKAEAIYDAQKFMSVADIAIELGWSEGYVHSYLKLHQLHDELLSLVDNEELSRDDRLSFQEAVELARAPLSEQFSVFRQVNGLPLAVRVHKIRNIVRGINGVTVKRRDATDHRRTLVSFLTRAGIILEDVMPHAGIMVAKSIIKKHHAEQVDRMIEVLDNLIEKFTKFRDLLIKEHS